jgi:hypothetical protein
MAEGGRAALGLYAENLPFKPSLASKRLMLGRELQGIQHSSFRWRGLAGRDIAGFGSEYWSPGKTARAAHRDHLRDLAGGDAVGELAGRRGGARMPDPRPVRDDRLRTFARRRDGARLSDIVIIGRLRVEMGEGCPKGR